MTRSRVKRERFESAFNVRDVRRAMLGQRRRNTNDQRFSGGGSREVRRRGKETQIAHRPYEIAGKMLDVCLSIRDKLNFFRVDVEAEGRQAGRDQGATERQANVTKADDADPRLPGFEIRNQLIRKRGTPHVA